MSAPRDFSKLSRQRALQLEYRRRGLCERCGAERPPADPRYCARHREQTREIAREYYACGTRAASGHGRPPVDASTPVRKPRRKRSPRALPAC